MRSHTLIINGLKQKVYLWGSPQKPKLFFFHGWLDTGASFDFVARYLKKDFCCIAPDMRGFGKSEHAKSELGYFFYEYIADVHALISRLAPHEKINIVGHSLGGAVTSFYAGTFPEKMKSFVNIEGFGIRSKSPDEAPARLRQWIEGLHPKGFNTYKDVNHFAARLQKSNPRLPRDRALFLAKYLGKKTRGGFMMAADSRHMMIEPHRLFQNEHIMPFLKNITARCLLVTAEKTELFGWITPKELKERMDAFPQDSHRAVIKDCGHMVHHEKPEELARLIKEFLKHKL